MILPQLASSSLLSLGQLCNNNCAILLDKKQLVAFKNKQIVLKGTRNHIDRLWDIPVTKHAITGDNYEIPRIHPDIYARRIKKPTLAWLKTTVKSKMNLAIIFKQELARFGDIVDHNILDNFSKILIYKTEQNI